MHNQKLRQQLARALRCESLEDRFLLAADAFEKPDFEQVEKESATPFYYQDRETPIGLNVSANRVVIGSDGDLQSLDVGGTFIRPIGNSAAVFEFDRLMDFESRQQLLQLPGVEFTETVFINADTDSEAVLLDEVIVRLGQGVTEAEFFTENANVKSYRRLSGTPDQFVITVQNGRGPAALAVANEFAMDDRLEWSAPNFYQDWQRFYTPDDTRFGDLWHLENTGQGGGLVGADANLTEAWDVNPGGSSNIVVGVIDDGVPDNHPDLSNYNVGETSGDLFDNDGNGWVDDDHGWDFVNNTNDWSPIAASDAHGTSVAGVAAAVGDNTLGVTGAAYNSEVFSARIFAGGSVATDANIAAALYYMGGRTEDGLGTWDSADVVNNSWGGGGVSTAINDALTWGTTQGRQGQGVTFFFSSGNGFNSVVAQPAAQAANIPGVIAIGSTNNFGERSDYSNYGTALDFVAPSNDSRPGYLAIDTTDRIGADGYAAGDYTGTGATGFGGTSSASPLAAGIAALALDELDNQSISLSTSEFRDWMRNNTALAGGVEYDVTTGKNFEFGYGRIDAGSLLESVGKAEISVLSPFEDLESGVSTVAFADAISGQFSEQTLRIRNQGTSTLNLSSLTVDSGPFSIGAGFGDSTLDVGESTTFTVRFEPVTGGIATGQITIGSDDADESSFVLDLEGLGLIASATGSIFEDANNSGDLQPHETLLSAVTVYIDENSNGVFDSSVTDFTNSTSFAISDFTTVASPITTSGLTGDLVDINVEINITHTYTADLVISLIAPSGNSILLSDTRGGSGQNYTATIFDDEAATNIASGSAPFTGSFQPEEMLSLLDNEDPNGLWQLSVEDQFGGDTGTIDSWTISIETGEASATSDSAGNFAFLNLPNGTYDLDVLIDPTWSVTSPASGYTFTISSPTDENPGLDFGLARNDRFYFHAFNDFDSDGTEDPGDLTLLNRAMFIDSNANGVYDAPTTFSFDNTTDVPFADNTTVTSDIVASGVGIISDVDVRIDATHTWNSDLDVFLIAPDGTIVELFTDVGGSSDNFTDTILDDEAATSILDGSAPFTGSFRPEGFLSDLYGLSGDGTWTLQITDDAGGDTGSLLEWEIFLTSAADVPLDTGATGYNHIDLPTGTHWIGIAPQPGWLNTSPPSGIVEAVASGAPMFDAAFGVVADDFLAVADIASTPQDTSVTIDVLQNDLPSGVNVVSSTPGANGSTTVEPNGDITYIPDSGFSGADAFDYTIGLEDIELSGSNFSVGDRSGYSVDIDGDLAVVGAYLDDPAGLTNAGTAYVFQRVGTSSWTQIAELNGDLNGDDSQSYFGWSVAISGNTVAVGAQFDRDNGFRSGAAYVFDRHEGGIDNWGRVAKFTGSDVDNSDFFGRSIDISGDTVVVGASIKDAAAGAAYVFERDQGGTNNWGQVLRLSGSTQNAGDRFGQSVAIDGDTIVVGAFQNDNAATNAGAVVVFDRNEGGPGAWGETAFITASDAVDRDFFGYSVSVDGDTIAVGSPQDDEPGKNQTGSVYVLGRDVGGVGNWGEEALLNASGSVAGDRLGWSVGVSGNSIVSGAVQSDIGGDRSGNAYLFQDDGSGWAQTRELNNSQVTTADEYGVSAAVSGDLAIVGSWLDNRPFNNTGGSYVFDLRTATTTVTVDVTGSSALPSFIGGQDGSDEVWKDLFADEKSDASSELSDDVVTFDSVVTEVASAENRSLPSAPNQRIMDDLYSGLANDTAEDSRTSDTLFEDLFEQDSLA